MRKVVFIGRVIPELRAVTAPVTPEFRYSDPRSGFDGTFKVEVKEAVVRVEATLARDNEEDLYFALIRALGFSRAVVDVIGFAKAWALHVVIDKTIIEGEERHWALSEQRAAPLCTAYSLESGFEEICDMVITDLKLRFAFHDLVSGIGVENYSPVAAGRAIDAIRHLIAGPDVPPKQGWPLVREALRIDEAYIRFVSETSAQPRHGDRSAVVGDTALEVMLRAWAIMNRYLEYRKRGGVQPLPADEFPTLEEPEL